MIDIGERERAAQRRVVRLFCNELGYEYLGDLSEGDNHTSWCNFSCATTTTSFTR